MKSSRRVRNCSAVLGLSLLLSACSDSTPVEEGDVIRPVRTAVVASETRTIERSYPAIVLPAQEVSLAFKVSGRVVELPIRASQAVKQGDIIAVLEQRDFVNQIEQIESQLAQATAQLKALETGARSEDVAALEARVNAARTQLQTQQAQVNRIRALVTQGTIARVTLEEELAKLSNDRSNLDVAEQELNKALAGARIEELDAQNAVIRGLETQLGQARSNLEDATLRAPFDGVIATRNIENETNVQANTTIATLQKLNNIDLQFDMPGVDVSLFSKQEEVLSRASLDIAAGEFFETELVEFSTQADPNTQTFRGRVAVDTPEELTVLPGMTGTVSVIAILDAQSKLVVPEAALSSEADGTVYVWVVDPSTNTVSKRNVETEALAVNEIAVSGEIEEGEIVVTAGVSFLRNGMQVRPLTTEEG